MIVRNGLGRCGTSFESGKKRGKKRKHDALVPETRLNQRLQRKCSIIMRRRRYEGDWKTKIAVIWWMTNILPPGNSRAEMTNAPSLWYIHYWKLSGSSKLNSSYRRKICCANNAELNAAGTFTKSSSSALWAWKQIAEKKGLSFR